MRTVYTVGHSTHGLNDFISMLHLFSIQIIVDIRRFPGSRKYPWFNKDDLARELQGAGIKYVHMEALGGRRKVQQHSKNTRWRNASFQGYADYMGTVDFEKAVNELETIAQERPTAYMCSESVWWRCHRSMVSDYLKARGWTVLHIMSMGKAEEHPYTSPARISDGRVFYSNDDLFQQ